MNRLSLERRTKIIQLLVEGTSCRAISRILDVAFNSVLKVLVETGKACIEFHRDNVKNLESRRCQLDEVHSFVHTKTKNLQDFEPSKGTKWVWVAMDADSRLIISWLVGERDSCTAKIFVDDVIDRIKGRVQITTDGLKTYIEAIHAAHMKNSHVEIDYGMLTKVYGDGTATTTDNETKDRTKRRYQGATKDRIFGEPNPKFISTAYLERSNLTLRMGSRRFTRKTNAFSKKLQNHEYAVALHYVYYNFCRIHKSLSITPAMQSGLTKRLMTISDIARLVPEPVSTKRGKYKKKDEK